MRRNPLPWDALLVVALGSAAAWWWRRARPAGRSSAHVEPSPGLTRGGMEPTSPVEVSSHRADLHRAQRPILVEAARRTLGREPTTAEVQYLHAIAWLESNYARGWKGAMTGSNNYGAVQCPSALGSECIEYEDSRADGTRYKVSFRRYDTPENGAADLAKNVFRRPRLVSALEESPSCFGASLAMRRGKYYEGFCPLATKAHGSDAARASFRDPDRDPGTEACEREAVTAHAKRCAVTVAEVAYAVGDAVRVPLGDFDDALTWWKATRPQV
jgi:hypothetical protein